MLWCYATDGVGSGVGLSEMCFPRGLDISDCLEFMNMLDIYIYMHVCVCQVTYIYIDINILIYTFIYVYKNLCTCPSLEKHSVSRRSYLFARLHLLSSHSFSSLIFSLLLFSSLTLPTSAFPSVHIVGSLTSKLPSIKYCQKLNFEAFPSYSNENLKDKNKKLDFKLD